MVAAGLTQPKYLAWKPVLEFGIGEKHSGRTGYVDTGRDVARAVVTDDDGFGSGGHLENAYAPMQAGIHARGVQQFEGELMASSRCWSWVSELTSAAPVPVAAMPDAARTLGGTPVAEMPAEAAGGASDAAPPAAAGGDGRRRRAPRYVGAVCGEVSGRRRAADHRSRECLRKWRARRCGVTGTGVVAAAGGGAEAEAGVTLRGRGGRRRGLGHGGGSGLARRREARPLANPCDRSLPQLWASVDRPARSGCYGMLGVLGMHGVLGIEGMEGIDGGFMPPPPPMPDIGLIGGIIPAPDCACCAAGAGTVDRQVSQARASSALKHLLPPRPQARACPLRLRSAASRILP